MSFNICSITGTVAEIPVVSLKSGHIFDKRVIEKHLSINTTCPSTNQPLTINDLMEVKVDKFTQPRTASTCSIPGLFGELQKEWDAMLLDTYKLKKELETAKQELSHSLYQHDAACRVISNLIRDRDSAREQLHNYKLALENMEDEELVGEEVNNKTISSEI